MSLVYREVFPACVIPLQLAGALSYITAARDRELSNWGPILSSVACCLRGEGRCWCRTLRSTQALARRHSLSVVPSAPGFGYSRAVLAGADVLVAALLRRCAARLSCFCLLSVAVVM